MRVTRYYKLQFIELFVSTSKSVQLAKTDTAVRTIVSTAVSLLRSNKVLEREA